MRFHLVYPSTSSNAQSPVRVVEQTGREVGWINRFLDREYVRRLAEKTLRTYAHNLVHFVGGWESVHHTGEMVEGDLAESTLLDYVRFQSGPQPRPSGSTINDRVALADRALRNEFPDAPCQIARGFHQAFLRRRPMGIGRPRVAISRLRVKEPKRNIVPLSVDEVARFWCSFRTSRDLAIVGLMLSKGCGRLRFWLGSRMTCCLLKNKSASTEKAATFGSCRWRRKPFNCSATICDWNGQTSVAPRCSSR